VAMLDLATEERRRDVLMEQERNWAGNYAYRARELRRPASVDELRRIVVGAERLRVLGSRHSFNDLPDSEVLVSLEDLPADVAVDAGAGTVTLSAGVRYGDLAPALDAHGVALHNLASLPHISVAGAVATGTHGSGVAKGNLATAVRALELVTSAGEVVRAARGDADFDGMVIHLGALGAVTRVTLDVEPAYAIRQRVFEGLEWAALLEDFDAVMAGGESVSVFTRLHERVDQVWVKSRVTEADEEVRPDLLGAPAATVERHPILGMDPVNATRQLGVPGPWWDRLPHFRMGFTPSNGDEIQSELHLPREHAVAAIETLRGLGELLRPVLQVCELRTIAADALWLSEQHERDTVALHFTWTPEPARVERVMAELEAAMAPFEPRPHWGKVFTADAGEIARRYPRLPDFLALAGRLDARGAFRNAWTERVLGL
jgi:alditol oxidase